MQKKLIHYKTLESGGINTKKLLAIILASLIMCSATACNTDEADTTKSTETTTATATTETEAETIASAKITGATAKAKEAMETLEKQGFQGVVYITKDDKVLATYTKGKADNGKPITIDTPMPLGSISKQFYAAAILYLKDQGKLSLDDTLDKYYSDYKFGNKITIKNLLSMRSGIPDYQYADPSELLASPLNTNEENKQIVLDWIFKQKPSFEADTSYDYSTSNCLLSGCIVEQVSGKSYVDFMRETFFEPLGMTHTGALNELSSHPQWAQDNNYIDLQNGIIVPDELIISSSADMTLWLDSLRKGKIVSPESYKAMTTDYSGGQNYGYFTELGFLGNGVGHKGSVGNFTALAYASDDENLIISMASSISDCHSVSQDLLMNLLY